MEKIEPYSPSEYNGMIRLDANESCFDLPKEIKAEIADKIKSVEFNRYPDPYASELCDKFAAYFNIDPENVVAANGSDEILSILFGAVLDYKSTVLLASPDFSMYRFYADLYGQNTVIYNKPIMTQSDCSDLFLKAKNVDLTLFSNPCNPTSEGIDAKDILNALSETDGIIVADEAYMDFWGESIIDKIYTNKNLIVLKTCSKAFGLAAARVGFAVADKKIIEMFKKAKSPYNVSSLDQAAASVVLSHPEYLKKRTAQIISARNKLYNGLKPLLTSEMRMSEPKANFVCIHTARAVHIYEKLRKYNIAVRCPEKNILRISAGTENETETLLTTFGKVVKECDRQ